MNNIQNWLAPENIHLNLKADSELEVIRAMIKVAGESASVDDVKKLASEVFKNEVYGPLQHDCCTVIFHASSPAVSTPLMFIGRFEAGFGYYSQKGHPMDLVTLIIAPPVYEGQLMSVIYRSTKLLCRPELTDRIRKSDTPAQIYELILSHWKDD